MSSPGSAALGLTVRMHGFQEEEMEERSKTRTAVPGPLPPNRVVAVELGQDEEVEWTPCGGLVLEAVTHPRLSGLSIDP